jgi:hypothetical protein
MQDVTLQYMGTTMVKGTLQTWSLNIFCNKLCISSWGLHQNIYNTSIILKSFIQKSRKLGVSQMVHNAYETLVIGACENLSYK